MTRASIDDVARGTCETCRFGLYHPRRTYNGRPDLTSPLASVECRRNPAFLTKQPIEWCGEYLETRP